MSRDHKHADEENTNALADKLKKQLSDSSDPELKQEHKIKTQRRISSSRNLDDLSTPPGDSETPPEEKFGDKLRESVPQDEKHEHPGRFDVRRYYSECIRKVRNGWIG